MRPTGPPSTGRSRRRARRTALLAPDPPAPGRSDDGSDVPATAGPTAGARPALTAMAAAGLACAWAAGGATAAGTLVASGAGAVVLTRWRAAAAGRERRATQIPGALDRLATALRAGTSLPSSLAEVGSAVDPPLGPELTALGEATARGRPVVDVLDDWAARHDDPPTRLAGTALVLATLVGSVPARAVDGVAATVRERLDLAAERRALAAQARASAVVLTVAPLAFAALLVAGDTAAAGFLLGSPAGWSCLAGGVGLDVAGGIWMARLTRGRR